MRRRPETEDHLWCHPHQTMHLKTAFSRSKHTASGFMFACREIISLKNKDAHAKDRERRNLRHKALRKKRRESSVWMTWALKRMLDGARRHALLSKGRIEFNLTLADLSPPSHCPVFGWELIYQASGKAENNSASLDRIDSRLGYVPSNVWIISWRANQIKNDATVEEMRAVADAIEKHHGGILKRYIKEREKDDLTQEPGEGEPEVSAEQLFFGWKQDVRRYKKLNQGGAPS